MNELFTNIIDQSITMAELDGGELMTELNQSNNY